ncbi:hypothetical protein TIFTF001_025556 [Ficus carica]|uniref:histidine--tRNA ligase n=1 Tax=Ficus carica TaxID=3494 RepID=A0AA88DEA3_FICCA|nr:hypothetical protein TIFTF001_025556 [Ficus carica]
MAERAVITLGGKGSSLSSSSVYAIANSLANLRIDSSAVARLASSDNHHASAVKSDGFNFRDSLTIEEKRASLIVLLNNLLLSGSSAAHRVVEALNSSCQTLEIESLGLAEEEILYGIFALVDHKSSALSAISDAVAAISCEASRADVSALNLTDSGDGFTDKDEVGVAGDMKVMLNGSKRVGKVESESVSKIPKIHATLRKQARLLHSETRVQLNSAVKAGSGAAENVRTSQLSLVSALRDLGRCSFGRAKLNLDSVDNGDIKSILVGLFEKQCPSVDGLRDQFKVVLELLTEEEEKYGELAHQVNFLLGLVWKIVAWEAITAFVALEGAELKEKCQGGVVNVGENVKAGKKSEKKKVVLGKGTSVLIQVIKSRLGSKGGGFDGSGGLLEKWVEDILSFFDPKDMEFDNLLSEVKEIVESNESRRLPKLPKGTRDFSKEQMTIRKKAFKIVEDVFEKHGATALDTPVFELSDVLKGKYGEDSKLIYDLADQIKLNHRKLLDGMLEICGVPAEKFRTICSSIDKLDKQSFEEIKKEMVEEKGLSVETADKIGTFVKERGHPLELLCKLRQDGSKFLENSSSIDALNDLEILFKALEESKCINRVTFDLSLARGLDYYTGVIFEAVFKGGAQQTRATRTDVLVSILGDDLSKAAELVSELWDADMYAEFSVNKRLSKHFDRAKESKIPWMLIEGDRERKEGMIRIKDFKSANEDIVVSRSRVVEELKARLNPSK